MTNKYDRNAFLENLNTAVDQFVDHSYKKAITISHNDADGISCLHIIQNLLYKMKIDYDYFIYNRSFSWSFGRQKIAPKKALLSRKVFDK